MRTRVLAALTFASLLAGCLGGDEPVAPAATDVAVEPTGATLEVPTLPDGAPHPEAEVAEAPAWRVGDAWHVEAQAGGEATRSTLVVTAAGGGSYTLSTTDEQMALYDALTDVSYVGKVRARDLAGHQHDQPVQFFDFPLRDGKAWTATWDGLEIHLVAAYSPAVPTATGSQPGFLVEGTTADGEPYVRYDYVPALRWWSHVEFAGGYGFRVTGAQENWTGEVVEAAANPLLDLSSTPPAGLHAAGSLRVGEDATYVTMIVAGHAEQHVRDVLLVDPAQGTYPRQTPNHDQSVEPSDVFLVETMPAMPGDWAFAVNIAHDPAGWFTVRIDEVAVTTRAFAPF